MVDYAEEHPKVGPQSVRLRRRFWLRAAPGTRARGLRRFGLAVVTFAITVCLALAIGGGVLFLLLARGPLPVALEDQVAKALSSRVGHGFTFTVGGTDIQAVEGRLALVVRRLLVRDETGRDVLRVPRASIAVDPLRLLGGSVVPTRLDIQDVILKLAILPDGDIALSAGSDEALPFRLSEAIEASNAGPHDATDATVRTDTPVPSTSPPAADDFLSSAAGSLVPLLDKLTGADDALGGFDRLGIQRAVLILDDRSHNDVRTFRNLTFDFEKRAVRAAKVSLSADGAAGRWSLSLDGVRTPDDRRSLALNAQNLTLDDVRMVPGLRDPGFDSDAPLSLQVDLGLDAAGKVSSANGRLGVGSGYFRLNDPDHEPVMLDRVETGFHLDLPARRLIFDPSDIEAGTTRYRFDGQLAIPERVADDWLFNGNAKGVFGAERPNEKPVALDRIDTGVRFSPGHNRFAIERLTVTGPQVDLGLKAEVTHGDAGVAIKATATAGRMPAPIILRLWPSLISAQVRNWLIANLQGGLVEHGTAVLALDSDDLAKIKAQHSVADNHLQLDYAVSDVTLAFMAGVPPLRGVVGTGLVTGDTSRFAVTRGSLDAAPGRQLSLADGSIFVPSTDPKPTPSIITAHVVGPIDALTDLLGRDALKTYAPLPPEAASAKGQVDGVLTVGLALGQQARADDLKVGATAKLTNLSIDKVVGKQNLTDGTILLTLDKVGVKAKGDATLFGAPTTIDIRKPAGTAPGEADIQVTLDDAARAKAGIPTGRALVGPVVAKVVSILGNGDTKASIDVDLSRATLVNPVPGLLKAAGKPGRLTLTATSHEGGVDLDNIACDIGSFSIRGAANLDPNGSMKSARISQFKLSPGDDLRFEATQTGDLLKIVARGTNLDARPFLKTLANAEPPDPSSKDVDLELHSTLLSGQNSQVLTGLDLRLLRRDGQIRNVQLKGRFGRAPISITSASQGNVLSVTVASADAGASLSFLDLYKRVGGGQLDASMRMLGNRMDGSATIHDFDLLEDPALKKLTQESLSQTKNPSTHIDASDIRFTKMLMTFSKTGSKVDVKDGAIFGPQMGATVQGSLDFSRDKIALAGTFVPIYGVNNLFSQLPLVGPILGGGAHEGLFGLNYKINGSIGNPNLSVDPLSALAPGFLRNIFGAISQAAEDNAVPSPSSPKPPE